MAGIGFELRRMIDERRGLVSKVRAYSCAGLISSGPWLMTILTLTLLNLAGPYLGGAEGYSLFRALVTYAFAFSLILQGIAQMAVTRRVADLLYAKRYERVLPAFVTSVLVVGAVHLAIGVGFCLWAGFRPVLSFLAVTLFAIIGMTWIALIWLTVVRQYDEILRAYVYGTLVALLGVVLLFLGLGTEGILAAYAAGQALTLILLLRVIARGMDASGDRDFTVLKSLVNFPMLVGVGLFYNAAIWVDKMVFWFNDGIGPHPLVRYHPLYDTCSFLAYLTVVPALAVNLVRLETAFYEKYRGYYGAILGGTPLAVIEDKKRRLLGDLEENVVRLLKTQGAITVAMIIFAPLILEVLKLPPIATRLFRLTCLGAFFHVMLLINILMQLYFDLRKQALATSLVFLSLNGILAWWSVSRGVETYGIGYATASFLALTLGYLLLHRSLERLDYMTFTSQPIGTAEERREAARLAEEALAEGEQEDTKPVETVHTVAPAPVQVAAGEMAPPEIPAEAVEEEITLEEEEEITLEEEEEIPLEEEEEIPLEEAEEPAVAEAVDAGALLPATEPIPEAAAVTATDVDGAIEVTPPEATATEPEQEAAAVTATDVDGAIEVAPPEATATEPEQEAAAVTATDVHGASGVTLPDATATEPDQEAAAVTATDVPGAIEVAPPAVTRATDVEHTDPGDADVTATEADPGAFERAATEAPEEVDVVRKEARPPDVTATELDPRVRSVRDLEEIEVIEVDAADPEAEVTATDAYPLARELASDSEAEEEGPADGGEPPPEADADEGAETDDETRSEVGIELPEPGPRPPDPPARPTVEPDDETEADG
ncbi:MAG: exopolysaccharide Pel transporter PelG [Planctomycetota bacterium]|jgi:uncharacterized membrane protein